MALNEDIYELFERVTRHPDYVEGTIWTRRDVAEAVFEPEDGWFEPDEAAIARVTPEMMVEAAGGLGGYIWGSQPQDWHEALRDSVMTEPAES